MHYLKPTSLALTASLLSAGVCANPFSYNELSVYYTHAIVGMDEMDSELKLNALTVNFNKELENQLFFSLEVGRGVIDQVITEENIKFDINGSETYVFAGVGKYFILDSQLNGYFRAGVIHSQYDLDIYVENTDETYSDSETDTDLGAQAGLRFMLSDMGKLELNPVLTYSSGSGDSSTSIGGYARWHASDKLLLNAGYDTDLEDDADEFSLGVSFILD